MIGHFNDWGITDDVLNRAMFENIGDAICLNNTHLRLLQLLHNIHNCSKRYGIPYLPCNLHALRSAKAISRDIYDLDGTIKKFQVSFFVLFCRVKTENVFLYLLKSDIMNVSTLYGCD